MQVQKYKYKYHTNLEIEAENADRSFEEVKMEATEREKVNRAAMRELRRSGERFWSTKSYHTYIIHGYIQADC